MLKVCEILRVGLGLSHAKRGSSEGSMLGKRIFFFCDLHRQQRPYTLYGCGNVYC